MECSRWKSKLLATSILTIIILFCPVTHGIDILVVPVDGSHWINMRTLTEELRLHGHNITVLHFSTAWYIKEMSDVYQSVVIHLRECLSQKETESLVQAYIQKTLSALKNGLTPWAFVQLRYQLWSTLYSYHRCAAELITAIFNNETVLRQLEDAKFDLVLTDPALGTGPMLAYYLKIPLVHNVRWFMSGEAHFLSAPSPLSYIPVPGSQYTSKMSFPQRIQNVFHNLLQLTASTFVIQPIYNELCHRYLGPDTDIETVLLRADVWLMRVDFIFEFPRPTMPNIVYVGGFQCKPSKPLEAEFEEFVQSSGEYGIIVMSMGTIVSSLPMHVTMQIAEALAQVPQKVIWRHNGKTPPNIGNNTLLAKWIPQNDLLGHPKTRAFIAHGGTNGVYEAIYHGVPVVGIPLLFDQFDNLLKLETRGAAKVINVANMQSTDLLQALNEVIYNTSYRENMQKLSALHRDQPESPMERAIFWIEYVARHKGAAHLRSESYRLPWYVYYCVDVMIFLVSLFLMGTGLTVVLLKKLCSIVWKNKLKIQ
ncbi:UDP-glucuronosyltransferase 2A2-like [Hemiscyllium ocellatum]|uniref:UDP-glucuronosyltransferase 2A2-like n=1 Tax=Hemiscyllium ocellatum TaxID=170820 RepID=UPI002966C534|nr:UDP-glucuronosyltransferase 2A2-like [Hemiscyllium ocellatum]